MPIIASVGRNAPRTRLLITAIYLILITGSITMIYPFALMLASSVTSDVDLHEYRVIPRYTFSKDALFRKYIYARYNGILTQINSSMETNFASLDDMTWNVGSDPGKTEKLITANWNRYLIRLPFSMKEPLFMMERNVKGVGSKAYQRYLMGLFDNDINRLNHAYTEHNLYFNQIVQPYERFLSKNWRPDDVSKVHEWNVFKRRIPSEYVQPLSADAKYWLFIKQSAEDGDVPCRRFLVSIYKRASPMRAANMTQADFGALQYQDKKSLYRKVQKHVSLPTTMPAEEPERGIWTRFVKTQWPVRFACLAGEKSRPDDLVENLTAARIHNERMAAVPVDRWILDTAEARYAKFLEQIYNHDISYLNHIYKTSYASFSEIKFPHRTVNKVYFASRPGWWRRYFFTRNYSDVLDFILLHGRAVWNTFVLVSLAILTALTINPLCAYALSKYNLPFANKVLLFLLATMAFPASVAMIPNFLLLKHLGFLNTYAALVLPGMANGYSIFLLKGFFDSLPAELYEAAGIEGASNMFMFWNITFPMSKPIFAVIALQTFTFMYGSFMWAFIVCQDPKMWTLMVYLYQYQLSAPTFMVMAALVLAALPTLLVFLFAQNIIMRGIIIPQMK